MKKVVKSNVAAQKWLWWSDNGKKFNYNISGGFWCWFPVGGGNTNLPEMLLLKILPLSDHHNHFWAATFDSTTLFMLPFFALATLFLQCGCFCEDSLVCYSFNRDTVVQSWYQIRYSDSLGCTNWFQKWCHLEFPLQPFVWQLNLMIQKLKPTTLVIEFLIYLST